MDKPNDCFLIQWLGHCPEAWVKHLTQLLVENNAITGFVHILPSAGLYLTQHFLECSIPKTVDEKYLDNLILPMRF